YYQLGNYKKTMEYYLIGYKYAVERDNIKLLANIRPMMAALKNRSGNHQEALLIHKEHLHALKNQSEYRNLYSNNPNIGNSFNTDIIKAQYNIGLTYLLLKQPDSSRIFLQKAITNSIQQKIFFLYYEILSSSGSMEFYAGNFQAALD